MEEPVVEPATGAKWLRVPPEVEAELEALKAGWNEPVPTSRMLLAAIRLGLPLLKDFSPHEVYGIAKLGAERFGVRVTRHPKG